MLGDELDRPTPVRSFHPARDFLRRTRAAQVDAELRAVVEDVNVGGCMVVRVDPDNEPLDNDPRHDLSVTYRVRFYNSGTVRRSPHQRRPESGLMRSRTRLRSSSAIHSLQVSC